MSCSSGLRFTLQINSAHELILTELILENTLAGYDPEEVVALISCFVFQEKTDVEPVIPPKLQIGRDAIQAIVEKVGAVQLKRGVGEDLAARIKFGLVEVIYEWAKGMASITYLFHVFIGDGDSDTSSAFRTDYGSDGRRRGHDCACHYAS